MAKDTDINLLKGYALHLSNWARGDVSSPGAVVVTENLDSIEWLKLPEVGLVSEQDFVLCALSSSESIDLPSGPGTWIRGTGGVSKVGDDVGLSRDLFIQTMDYESLRYLNVFGPTIIRILTVEDTRALLIDVMSTLRTGRFVKQLLHPMVEIGDQCALVGASDCSGRHLRRLHVDRLGNVRTSPAGRILGQVGVDRNALSAQVTFGQNVDPCLSEESTAVLFKFGFERIRAYLTALAAVRVLSQRSSAVWRVVGWGDDLVNEHEVFVPRSDQFLLTDEHAYVLYDSDSKRAFRMDLAGAELAGSILLSGSRDEALLNLHSRGRTEFSLDHIEGFREEMRERDLELSYAKP